MLAALLPTLALGESTHAVHLAMVLLAVPLSLRVVWSEGWSEPRSRAFSALVIVGLAMLVAGVALAPNLTLEVALTIAGGLLVAGGHIWNWQRRQVRARRRDAT